MEHNKLLEEYGTKEFIKAKEEIKRKLIRMVHPENEPIAFMLGGQPGAGKTGLQEMLEEKHKNLIKINIDKFRKNHPNFKKINDVYGKDSVNKTNKFAAEMTDALVEELSDSKYSMIIEGTLRTADTSLDSQKKLKLKGYLCELVVIAVRPEISYIGTKLRYEYMYKNGQIPRDTDKKFHDLVVKSLPNSLEEIYSKKVFDNIRIFDREKNCLYDQSKTPNINPKNIILDIYNKTRSKNEIIEFKQEVEKVRDLMKERKASDLEFKQFEMEYKEQLENIEDNLLKNNNEKEFILNNTDSLNISEKDIETNENDIVNKMFSRDSEALQIYKNDKYNEDFKINKGYKKTDKDLEI